MSVIPSGGHNQRAPMSFKIATLMDAATFATH